MLVLVLAFLVVVVIVIVIVIFWHQQARTTPSGGTTRGGIWDDKESGGGNLGSCPTRGGTRTKRSHPTLNTHAGVCWCEGMRTLGGVKSVKKVRSPIGRGDGTRGGAAGC